MMSMAKVRGERNVIGGVSGEREVIVVSKEMSSRVGGKGEKDVISKNKLRRRCKSWE